MDEGSNMCAFLADSKASSILASHSNCHYMYEQELAVWLEAINI